MLLRLILAAINSFSTWKGDKQLSWGGAANYSSHIFASKCHRERRRRCGSSPDWTTKVKLNIVNIQLYNITSNAIVPLSSFSDLWQISYGFWQFEARLPLVVVFCCCHAVFWSLNLNTTSALPLPRPTWSFVCGSCKCRRRFGKGGLKGT